MAHDLREMLGEPSPRGVTPEAAAETAVEACGCFDAARGPQRARGFRVRLGERYFSCQYAAFLRTGEVSGWDAEIGKEVLYVVFAWGTLVVTGAGLAVLDDLLNEHRLARLSLGEGRQASASMTFAW